MSLICHSKSAIEAAPQDVIKTTRRNSIRIRLEVGNSGLDGRRPANLHSSEMSSIASDRPYLAPMTKTNLWLLGDHRLLLWFSNAVKHTYPNVLEVYLRQGGASGLMERSGSM
jgi:hypothetical protein